MKFIILGSFFLPLLSCFTLKKLPEANLGSDYYYLHRQEGGTTKVYVDVDDDSIGIVTDGQDGKGSESVIPSNGQALFKKSFDVDVMTVPFKFNRQVNNLPRQLNVDFNGNLFLGYRVDRYKLIFIQTPSGIIKKVRHRAITLELSAVLGQRPSHDGQTVEQPMNTRDSFSIVALPLCEVK